MIRLTINTNSNYGLCKCGCNLRSPAYDMQEKWINCAHDLLISSLYVLKRAHDYYCVPSVYYFVHSIYKLCARFTNLFPRFAKSCARFSKSRERNSNRVHVLVHWGNELVNREHNLFIFSCMSYAGLRSNLLFFN